jgi:hypothetical protein
MNFDVETIKSEITQKGFSIIENKLIKETTTKARSEYFETIRNIPVNSPVAPFSYMDLKDRPWKKYAFGSRNGVGESYAQMLQTTYFPEKDSRFPGLTEVFAHLITLRNESGSRQILECLSDSSLSTGRWFYVCA